MPPPANIAPQAPVASPTEHPNAWASFWQTVIRYDAAKVTPWLALRNAIGVALPLVAGVAADQLSAGLVAGTGALNVAFSDSQEPYRQRARRMLAASVLVGFAVFAGALCGRSPVIAVATAAVWAFAAGMLVALSSAAADLGTVSLVVLVVYGAFPMSPEKAVLSGLLAFGGGLLQIALAVALWPLRPYAPERRVVGELYRELARAAASPGRATEAPPASAQSTQAQSALATLDHSVEAERYRSLLSQAERMRLSLLTLARLRGRIGREEPANPGGRNSGPLFRSFLPYAQLPRQFAGCGGTGDAQFPRSSELENLAEQLRDQNDAELVIDLCHAYGCPVSDGRNGGSASLGSGSGRVRNASGFGGLRAA